MKQKIPMEQKKNTTSNSSGSFLNKLKASLPLRWKIKVYQEIRFLQVPNLKNNWKNKIL